MGQLNDLVDERQGPEQRTEPWTHEKRDSCAGKGPAQISERRQRKDGVAQPIRARNQDRSQPIGFEGLPNMKCCGAHRSECPVPEVRHPQSRIRRAVAFSICGGPRATETAPCGPALRWL